MHEKRNPPETLNGYSESRGDPRSLRGKGVGARSTAHCVLMSRHLVPEGLGLEEGLGHDRLRDGLEASAGVRVAVATGLVALVPLAPLATLHSPLLVLALAPPDVVHDVAVVGRADLEAHRRPVGQRGIVVAVELDAVERLGHLVLGERLVRLRRFCIRRAGAALGRTVLGIVTEDLTPEQLLETLAKHSALLAVLEALITLLAP